MKKYILSVYKNNELINTLDVTELEIYKHYFICKEKLTRHQIKSIKYNSCGTIENLVTVAKLEHYNDTYKYVYKVV